MADLKHRGVELLSLKDGRTVVRWMDAVNNRPVQEDTAPLAITNAAKRRLWPIAKTAEPRQLEADIEAEAQALARALAVVEARAVAQ